VATATRPVIRHPAPALILASTLAVATIAPPVLQACSCARPKAAPEALAQSEAVFVGDVISVERADSWWGIAAVTLRSLWAELRDQDDPYVDAWERSVRYGRVTEFHVMERFKGAATPSVSIHTGFGEGDCGYAFSVGATYLVYAYLETDATDSQKRYLRTSICTRTAPYVAGDEVDELRHLTRVIEQ
jgi:hypothetical protein